MRCTRTVPHPRWPGRKVSAVERRARSSCPVVKALKSMAAELRAVAAEARRARALTMPDRTGPAYAQREAFVREAVGRAGLRALQGSRG